MQCGIHTSPLMESKDFEMKIHDWWVIIQVQIHIHHETILIKGFRL